MRRQRDCLRTLVVVLAVALAPVAGAVAPAAASVQDQDQAEPTTIDSCTTIDEPGTYELNGTIDGTNASEETGLEGEGTTLSACLSIAASNVTLVGNGSEIRAAQNANALDAAALDVTELASNQSAAVAIAPPSDGDELSDVHVRDLDVSGWLVSVAAQNATNVTASNLTASNVSVSFTGSNVALGSVDASAAVGVDEGPGNDSNGTASDTGVTQTIADDSLVVTNTADDAAIVLTAVWGQGELPTGERVPDVDESEETPTDGADNETTDIAADDGALSLSLITSNVTYRSLNALFVDANGTVFESAFVLTNATPDAAVIVAAVWGDGQLPTDESPPVAPGGEDDDGTDETDGTDGTGDEGGGSDGDGDADA